MVTEIVGSELTMLGSRNAPSAAAPMNNTQSESPFPSEGDTGSGLTDDDIPF